MILTWLILLPFAGGILAWWIGRWSQKWPRWIALAALAGDAFLALGIWIRSAAGIHWTGNGPWLAESRWAWVPALGIRFHLAMDSLSLLLVVLTVFLGLVAVACSWTEIRERVGFFHFHLLWVLAGVIGVFVAMDLFLFYFFWELMLVPMYFLVAVWGHERRIYAAVKFLLFTQLSSLLMLVAIIGLYLVHGEATGTYTFDYRELLGTAMPPWTETLLMLGFLIAFLVKLPVFPLHTWLPDAHTEAPTAGSVILAGLLLKTGAYGLLRFALPLFPHAALDAQPLMLVLGVLGVLYGAWLAFAQTDLKRLVAYTSVSHMGFVLLGVFAWNELALQGTVMQMLCHGISTGALFILTGALQERTHTRDMNRMGGLWARLPRLGGVAMVFAMASLGLPGMGNFVGEFLVLAGLYQVSVAAAVWAALGLVSAAIYSLWIIQKVFHGEKPKQWTAADLGGREMVVFTSLIAAILWLGIYPQTVLKTVEPSLRALQHQAAGWERRSSS